MKGARPFTGDDEIKAFLRAIRGKFSVRDKAVAALGLKCGGRISQLLSLRVGDVFRCGRFAARIYFRRGIRKGKVEGQSLPFHPALKMTIGRWLVELRRKSGALRDDDYLFASRKGNRPIGRKSYWSIMARATRAAKLAPGISTHSMRKTVARRVYKSSGHCLLVTGRVLGHRSVATTAS